MSVEVRRVPSFWNHPKDINGDYIPLSDGFMKAVIDWDIAAEKWEKGFVRDYKEYPKINWVEKSPDQIETYTEWDGGRPSSDDYMPDYSESERTHYQMYETVTEGTPISPVMPTPEDLAHWLADNCAFGDMTASYTQWLATIENGFAPTMILVKYFDETSSLDSGVAVWSL
jgi:hypothetical protein